MLLAFIWGWSFLFIKVAVEGMTPTTVAAARVSLGAAVLIALCRLRRVPLPRQPAVWRHFVIVGLVGSALPFTMLAWGEQRISSALTSVLNASTPLFTAALAAVLLQERLRRVQMVGLIVGLAGVAVASGLAPGDLGSASFAGSMASVGAGACYGFSFAYSRRHLMSLAPMVAAAGQLTAAAVLLSPVALASSLAEGLELTVTRVLAIGLLGVAGSGLAYVLNFRIIAELGPTRASLVTYLIPVVAVAVGVGLLDEQFRASIALGGGLIVAGIALVNGVPTLAGRSAGQGPVQRPQGTLARPWSARGR